MEIGQNWGKYIFFGFSTKPIATVKISCAMSNFHTYISACINISLLGTWIFPTARRFYVEALGFFQLLVGFM